VADEQKAALKKAAGVSGGKNECQVVLKGRERDYTDILAAAIEILQKRIAAGTATFLVKVKEHRGEPANKGADILADNATSDSKVGKEWCQRTNRAVFTWKQPCREAGKVTYQDRHSTFNIP